MDGRMWAKIPESFFFGKFVELDGSLSNTKLMEDKLPALVN